MSHPPKELDKVPNEDFVIRKGVLIRCTNKDLTTVVIPDGIRKIEHSAFEGCSNLKMIVISNSVMEIGGDAFNGCSSLVSVEIPDSVTEIGPGAFWGCSSLVSVKIPLGVTEIAPGTFWGCSSLVSVEIPNSIAEIGTSAFSRCSHLTSILIPDSVTEIGEYAFSFCSRLTSVEIPDSVTKIGDYAFSGCSSLTLIEIPSVTKLGISVFSDCSKDFKCQRVSAREKATRELLRSAETGNIEAQFLLGECYFIGEGVEKDYMEAVKWYRKAAEQGDSDAQFALGECYYQGIGINENKAKAAKWFHEAATQGNEKAQIKLRRCYHINIGVEKKTFDIKTIRENNTSKRENEQANDFDEESEIELHDEIEELNAFEEEDDDEYLLSSDSQSDERANDLDDESDLDFLNEVDLDAFIEAEEDTLKSSAPKQVNNKRSHFKDGLKTEEYIFSEDNVRVFQLHIELLEYDVSADIQVREDMTFEALHRFLNKLFERDSNSHYRFECDDGLIAVCDKKEVVNETEALSKDCFIGHHLSIDKGAYYIFNNGNEWNHRIIVKEILVAEPKEQYPKAINMVIKIKGDIPEQFPLGLFQNSDRRLRRRGE